MKNPPSVYQQANNQISERGVFTLCMLTSSWILFQLETKVLYCILIQREVRAMHMTTVRFIIKTDVQQIGFCNRHTGNISFCRVFDLAFNIGSPSL